MALQSKAYRKPRFVVGIDEVGRGPLAGPVAVGALCVALEKKAHIRRVFNGIRDSKKLSALAREKWAKVIKEEAAKGNLVYDVVFASNTIIDKKGIAPTIRSLVARALKQLKINPETSEILLDGSLKAPAEFTRQKTIIKGDDLILEISVASVIAKVTRDARMVRLAKKYPEYGFEVHKGYGTKRHAEQLRLLGPCNVHRKTFISKF